MRETNKAYYTDIMILPTSCVFHHPVPHKILIRKCLYNMIIKP